MIFNGIDLTPYFRIKDIRGRGLIKRRINGISVPGMEGEYVESVDTPSKVLEVGIRIISDDLRKTIDELNAILATDEPVPIVFPDEPDMTYYGTVEDTKETGEKVHLGWHDTTIYIRRSDPYKYGPEITATFPSDVVTLTNNGTAEADPVFELEVLQPVTFAMIQNQKDEYMMIGRSVDVEDIVYEQMSTILHDEMSSTVGWVTGVNVDDRVVTGKMLSNGSYFYAESFGTGLEGQYHGPALRRSLSETVQDFRAEALVRFSNAVGEVGRLELHLLDGNSNLVGRVGLYDSSPSRALTKFNARAGTATQGQQITDTTADYWQNWTNFFGLIRLERKGIEWTAYATLIDEQTWTYHTAHKKVITTNYATSPIAQVQIHLMTYTAPWGTYEPVYMRVEELWVRRLNDMEGIPYIANPGDIITFDHANEDILVNGEPKLDLKDFGANYFKLAKGENQLIVIPSDSFNVKCKYREKFK